MDARENIPRSFDALYQIRPGTSITELDFFQLKLESFSRSEMIWDHIYDHREAFGFSNFIYRQKVIDMLKGDEHMRLTGRGNADLEMLLKSRSEDIRKSYIVTGQFNILAPESLEDFLVNLSQGNDLKHLGLAEVAKQHFAAGWIFPVYGTRGRHGFFLFNLTHKVSPSLIRRLQWLSQVAHLAQCRVQDQQYKSIALTEREATIMYWVARGKSNSVIAEIMGISSHTVNGYLRKIFLKTDTTDRTAAVIRLVQEGLIQ